MKRKTTSAGSARIPILDFHLASFHLYHGNTPELELQGTRVIFCFEPNDTFYRLTALYNKNEFIGCLDFVKAQRQLRAMMLSLREGAK